MTTSIVRIDMLSATKCLVHELRPLTFDHIQFGRKLDALAAMLMTSQRRLSLVRSGERRKFLQISRQALGGA